MVAVGSGAALKMGEEGNADVLLVHAPASELVLDGKGIWPDRLLIMHNDFIIVGPAGDPAGIKDQPQPKKRMKRSLRPNPYLLPGVMILVPTRPN